MYAYLSRVCGKDLDSFVLLERKSDRPSFTNCSCNIEHDLGGVCHMLANLIPTSVQDDCTL